jgi:hypothetical protein
MTPEEYLRRRRERELRQAKAVRLRNRQLAPCSWGPPTRVMVHGMPHQVCGCGGRDCRRTPVR